MKDNKVNQRIKQFNNGKILFYINFIETLGKSLNDSRLNFSLSLRKNKLFNNLMKKRHEISLKLLKNSELIIDINSLSLEP